MKAAAELSEADCLEKIQRKQLEKSLWGYVLRRNNWVT